MIIEQPYTQIPQHTLSSQEANTMTQHLESGQVLYFKNLDFKFEEALVLGAEAHLNHGRKSMTYNPKDGSIKGIDLNHPESKTFKNKIQAYTTFAEKLIRHLCPFYADNLITGRASFRPVEVKGRKLSYRKDDTRLHVDAFPSTPMGDYRILRVFSNVNPHQQSRIWRLGEPFEQVVSQFFPRLRKPLWGERQVLKALHLTKKERSLYDHYMLQLHNQMKYDLDYQATAKQQTIPFPAGSTWVVYSDSVSHAAMSGVYLLEQTFYLPYTKMLDPQLAPQSILGRYISIANKR